MYHRLPQGVFSKLNQPNTVLLQTNKFDSDNYQSLLFRDPKTILTLSRGESLGDMVEAIEGHLKAGFYAAGYFSYEVSSEREVDTILPTAWFGIYEKPWKFDHRVGSKTAVKKSRPLRGKKLKSLVETSFSFGNSLEPEAAHKKATEIILKHIKRGDAYQINLCGQFDIVLNGAPENLYQQLLESFPAPYSAFIRTDRGYVISLSPELFFSREASKIIAAPMKGTAGRGRTLLEDADIAKGLAASEKGRAENVMIVDLMRNDLTKIASEVTVSELFKIEKFLTLFQLTSIVEAKLRPETSYSEIFRALFPSGSVTGAPKHSSVEIINDVEQTPRGVYTGAIGYFSPDDKAAFSVAIRTIEGSGHRAKMGAGGGIVWDSIPADEYQECLLKGNFLTSPLEEFVIFETILWDKSFKNLERHLSRLKNSAAYFDYSFDLSFFNERLAEFEIELGKLQSAVKVKVSLDRFGAVSFEHEPATAWSSNKIALWPEPVSSLDRFLFHKTSRRKIYDLAAAKAKKEGFADYLFVNERGEITEGAISNLFIKNSDKYYTPPVNSGVLAGICREILLEKLTNCAERVLRIEDLHNAEEIIICNAIRGTKTVCLLNSSQSFK